MRPRSFGKSKRPRSVVLTMTNNHRRNTSGMRTSPRCRAKTRKGSPCQAPAVAGKQRCRMHGGAAGSGAPKGNRNALKHGMFTKEMKAERAYFRELVAESKELLRKIEKS
jgi:uncharacterized protein YjcR